MATWIAIAIAAAVLAPDVAVAQGPPQDTAAPLTLAAAVEHALTRHPAPRAARADVDATTAEIAVARTGYLPRLDLLWQTNRATRNNVFSLLLPQFVVPPVSGPVLSGDTGSSVWSSAGGFLLSWEAVDFGRRAAAVDVAEVESRVATARLDAADLDIAEAAGDAHLAVLAAEAVAEAARANERRLATFVTTVRALVEQELRAGVELSRADAELAAATNRVVEADRDVELARIALGEATGSAGPVAAVALPSSAPPPLEPSIATPAPLHPRLEAAQAEIDAARARDRLVERSAWPRVELQTAVSGRGVSRHADGTRDGSGFWLDVPNWAVGVTVSVPALDAFRVHARRKVETARRQAAESRLQGAGLALESARARARAVTAAAIRVATNTPRQLRAAEDARRQTGARYEVGLATVVDVADAERVLAQAEAESAVARLAVWRAWLAEAALAGDVEAFRQRLDRAQGTR